MDRSRINYTPSNKKFGDEGFAWLDSDGKENGEWSIIGIKPKKIIQIKRYK